MKKTAETRGLPDIFGDGVFHDRLMEERLPEEVYRDLKDGKLGDPEAADLVAKAMMDWAVEKGATHYAHWFQPMNNATAGKHDAFLQSDERGGVILKFSGKALIRGETDSSSFPSGGLRSTFEARGYTAWDPTSPAFVRDGTLYIPTAFCAYIGEAMDGKTPLLRSMEALSREGVRFLQALGMEAVGKLSPMVGAEQEYFLLDRELSEQRLDLKLCGRTLLGARATKGQELEDHYCGRIQRRVAEFMKELDRRLWRLGLVSKTKHKETAPAQYELAVEYATANIACDQNQLLMETMVDLAVEQGLVCLLHEKPFAGINGSGKHNNYSLLTDTGINLLEPGQMPEENVPFLLTLCAFLRGVDRYGDLLQMSAACPGNDHRLGEGEAPPSVISIFLGTYLVETLRRFSRGGGVSHREGKLWMDVGVEAIPPFQVDESDRNRTSPLAFTGNKFEFRMLGASQSLSCTNTVLNTILAESFGDFAERLEKAEDRGEECRRIVADTLEKHGRILFNGNNYDPAWIEEAKRRGLPLRKDSLSACEAFLEAKNVALFGRFHVFSEKECRARCEVLLENHRKVRRIEAATLLEMGKRQILPACIQYAGQVARSCANLRKVGILSPAVAVQLQELSEGIELLSQDLARLEELLAGEKDRELPSVMDRLRGSCDSLETIVDRQSWPLPTYTDLLYRI